MGNSALTLLASYINDRSNKSKLQKVFKAYDTKDLGSLDKKQFRLFTVHFTQILSKISKVAISTSESKWKFPDQVFKMVDLDENGQICFDEFQKILEIKDFWELAERLHEFNPRDY